MQRKKKKSRLTCNCHWCEPDPQELVDFKDYKRGKLPFNQPANYENEYEMTLKITDASYELLEKVEGHYCDCMTETNCSVSFSDGEMVWTTMPETNHVPFFANMGVVNGMLVKIH